MFRRAAVPSSRLGTAAVRFAATDAPQGGAKAGGSFAANVEEETLGTKVKKEVVKTLKLQLILVPVCFAGMFWMYPPVSAAEEKRLQERYEKSAGWKT